MTDVWRTFDQKINLFNYSRSAMDYAVTRLPMLLCRTCHGITFHHSPSHSIVLHYMYQWATTCSYILWYVISCNLMLLDICRCMPCHANTCHVMPTHAMSCQLMPCHANTCHVMLCRVWACNCFYSRRKGEQTVHAMSCHMTNHALCLRWRKINNERRMK